MSRRRETTISGRSRGVIPRGFTLIELMVTIMVLAVLLGLGVPSFREAALSSRVTSYANDLVASVQLARSEAIKRNAPVTLCASSDGTVCEDEGGWEVGWIVATADGTILQRQPPADSDYRITEAADTVEVAMPATVVRDPPTTLTFTVCRFDPVGGQERVVTVTPSGGTSVRRTSASVCPEAG
jgi:type IV fimbrial biogenesis protein FimT